MLFDLIGPYIIRHASLRVSEIYNQRVEVYFRISRKKRSCAWKKPIFDDLKNENKFPPLF